jgi:hypothetical protein
MERAEHYRDLAKRYLRLAASTDYPNHYLRIAVQYNALAEVEEGARMALPHRCLKDQATSHSLTSSRL